MYKVTFRQPLSPITTGKWWQAGSLLRRELNFPECISALDAALADFMPRMTGEQIAHVRIVMLTNNEIVVKEMEAEIGGDGLVF